MTDLQRQWIAQVEDYYRDQYPRSMAHKVLQVLPTRRDVLSALFSVLTRSVSAQYRTVPDVIAIETALSEVREGYPELRADSYNRQLEVARALIGDDADNIPREANLAYLEHIQERLRVAREEGRSARDEAATMTEEYCRNWIRQWQETYGAHAT